MTDNERMDRAKRIREMREGDRSDETPSDETGEESADGGPEKQTMEDIVEATADDTEWESTATGSTEERSMTDESQNTTGADVAATDDTGNGTASVEGDDGVKAPLPQMDELEEALEGSETTAEPETVSAGVTAGEGEASTEGQAGGDDETAAETTTEEETRVLEFTLDDEHYCLDIEYIEEIVKHENITRVPNTPEHVEGVVDLRGQITTILNPKVTIGKENKEAGELIVVFDAEAFEDQGYIGWVVDDVRQVSPIVESEVNDPPMSEEYINGVIDREDDDEFVIWTSPDLAFDEDD